MNYHKRVCLRLSDYSFFPNIKNCFSLEPWLMRTWFHFLVCFIGIAWEIDNQNVDLKPDLQSFCILPWLEETSAPTASIMCDLELKGRDLEYWRVCCRQQCKTQLQKLKEMGYSLFSAFEYEFYLVDKDTFKPIFDVTSLYSDTFIDEIRPFVYKTMKTLDAMGINTEMFTTEFAPGQQELTLSPEFGIKSMDNAIRYKKVVKAIAKKHGMEALFLSKPYPEESGSSNHFNHSLWHTNEKTNAFSDPDKPYKLSEICMSWIGGLQEHSKALAALFWANMNCFERCKPGTFAPTNNSWGFDNRTICYRVKNDSPSVTYVENRIPGAGSNPYLVTTGCLIAGMDGIKRNLKPKSEPYKGNLYEVEKLPEGIESLPTSFEEALRYLQEDEVLSKELGDVFIKAFSVLRNDEIKKWNENFESDEQRFEYYRKLYGKFL